MSEFVRYRVLRGVHRVLDQSLLLIAVLGFLVVWPAIMLVIGSVRTAPLLDPGSWSLTEARDGIEASGGIARAIRLSAVVAVTSTVFSLVLGAVFAFLGERTNTPLRRAIPPLMVISFATPILFQTLGLVLATNERTGLVDTGVRLVFGGDHHVVTVASLSGLIAISTVHGTGFAYLFLRAPIRALNGAHHEASLVSGAGRLQTFFRVDLPLLTPALTGVGIVLFVVGIGIFDSVRLLAPDGSLMVIGTKIYQLLNGPVPPAYAGACAIAVGLIVVVALAVGVQRLILGRHRHTTVAGKGFQADPVALGWSRWLGTALVVAYGLAFVVLPLASLIATAIQPFPGVYHSYTFRWFDSVLNNPDIARAANTTLLLSIIGGGLAVLAGFGMAYVRVRTSGWRAAAIRVIAFLPLAMPGIVIALAVLWAYVSVPGLRATYGTVWILCAAAVVLALPFTYQAADAALSQVSPELEEAARTSGAPAWRASLDIVVRLLLPSFVAAWLVAAIVIAGSLQLPLLLSAPSTKTFALVVAEYYTQGRFGEASALILVQLLVVALVLVAARLLVRLAGVLRNANVFESRARLRAARPLPD